MDVIKSFIIILLTIIVGSIVNAYVFYFVGMAFSLATSPIITLDGETVAMMFAGVGALVPTYIIANIVLGSTEVHRMDADEFTRLFDDIDLDDKGDGK